jgi:hypothetical protein
MAVAAQTAKAWREASQEDNAVTIPETPEDVKGRLDAIWADAYRAALAAVTPERDRLAAEAKTLRAEVEALTVSVTEVEDERDQAQTKASEEKARADQTEQTLQETIQALHQAQADTTSRDQQLTALEKDRDRLSKQLDALIEKLPHHARPPSEKTRHHEENHHHPEELTAAYVAYNGRTAHPKSRGDLFIRQTISPQPLSCVQSFRSHHRGTPWHLSFVNAQQPVPLWFVQK